MNEATMNVDVVKNEQRQALMTGTNTNLCLVSY